MVPRKAKRAANRTCGYNRGSVRDRHGPTSCPFGPQGRIQSRPLSRGAASAVLALVAAPASAAGSDRASDSRSLKAEKTAPRFKPGALGSFTPAGARPASGTASTAARLAEIEKRFSFTPAKEGRPAAKSGVTLGVVSRVVRDTLEARPRPR